MPNSLRLVRASVSAYRSLIWLYPRRFRRRFGAEMAQVFEEMACDVVAADGTVGLAKLWYRSLWDTLKSATRERAVAIKEAFGNDSWLLRNHWRVAFVVSMAVAMFVTPADPVSMLLLGFPVFGAYLCIQLCKPTKPKANLTIEETSHV